MLKISCWNSDWATPSSKRGKFFIDKFDSDIICLTEGYENLPPKEGYIISPNEDYGYKTKKGRKKVILWSKNKWTEVDQIGSKKFHQEDLYQVLQMELKLLVFVSLGDLLMSVREEKIVNHGKIISLLFRI